MTQKERLVYFINRINSDEDGTDLDKNVMKDNEKYLNFGSHIL